MEAIEGTPERRSDTVVARWLERALAAAAANRLDAPETRDLAPALLDALLASRSPETDARLTDLLGEHVGGRMRSGHPLSEIVEELAGWARVVTQCWTELTPAEQPAPDQLDHLLGGLQHSIAWVTDTFEAHMRDDEQRDKHATRRLEHEARTAMRRGASSEEVTHALLAVVVDVMRCDAGAILLYDAETAKLVEVAGAGRARETLEREVVDIASKTFESEVARSDAPAMAIEDITTRSLEVSPALRASGIHAMLGVRLPARSQLFGVLSIGVTEVRRFSDREVRRLELLGERVLVHLESTYLQAELRASLEALRAERSTREKFVSLLAHDLRTPLSNAKLGAQLLAAFPEIRDDRREALDRIVRNIDRADGMLRDLLDVSRMRAGQPLPVKRGPVDLADVVRAVVAELPAASAARVVVATDPVRGSWDRHELERALGNLVSNALKYGDATHPITVGASLDGARARLAVHNFGDPLAAGQHARIFDPFVQEVDGRGWGLGLAVVQACAYAHGGRVVVESDGQRGTTFTIELPLEPPMPARLAPSATPSDLPDRR